MKPRRIAKPSPRNLAIYRAVIVEGGCASQAAREHQLSKTRIAQICEAVEKYVSRQTDEELPELSYSERGQHLRRQFVEQLRHQWRQAMAEWRRSMEQEESLRVSSEEPGTRGSKRAGKRIAVSTRKSRAGAIGALRLANKVLERIFELRGGAQQPKEPTYEYEARDPEQFRLRLDRILIAIGARQDTPIPRLCADGDGPAVVFGDALDAPHPDVQASEIPDA